MSTRREVLKNNPATTLASGIADGTTTSVSLTDGSVFPSTGDFRIIVGSEIMLVTARSTNTLTVVRGQEGTTGVSHSSGAAVTQILTSGAMQKYGRDNTPWFDGSRPPFRLLDASGNTLASSDFTVVNGTNATVADVDGAITITKASVSGQDFALLARSKSNPATLIGAARIVWPRGVSSARNMLAFGFRESATGKLLIGSLEADSSGLVKLSAYAYSSPTAETATRLASNAMALVTPEVWFKAVDDGTNNKLSISVDGVTWVQFYSQSRTSDFTTQADQFVFGPSANGNSFSTLSSLVAWSES